MSCKDCGNICPHCDETLSLNTDYDIPYTGGFSQDGGTVYIDKRLPNTFTDSRNHEVNVYQYLIIHEVVEQALMNVLKLDFNVAHLIAMGAQMYALAMDNVAADEYFGFQQKYVDFNIKPDDIESVPPDLDLRPYEADHLTDVIAKIKELQNK